MRSLLLALGAISACAIPNTQFQASADGSTNGSGSGSAQIMLTTTTLTVPEGMTGTFGVSLTADPGGDVTVSIASSAATALPVSPSSLSFTSANYSVVQMVSVSPPVDANDVAETATVTVSGTGLSPVALNATVADSTVIEQFGWPTAFTATEAFSAGDVTTIQITVADSTNIASFGIFVPAASGDYRLALYADSGNAPAALVAQMPVRTALVNGSNTGVVNPAVALPNGKYWIAMRLAQTTAVGKSATATGQVCFRNIGISSLDDVWPDPFGANTCSTSNLLNLWIDTYHQ
jgi:hypothetical protein